MKSVPQVRLGNVATIDREIIEPANIADGTLYVGLEHIEPGGRFVNVEPVKAGDLASSKFAFTPNHLLYGKLRPYLAKVAQPNFRGVCSTDILPVLPGPQVDRAYLRWLLLSPEMVGRASSRATGANLPRLSPSALEEFAIPLPSLCDQQRIAAILDRADAMRATRRVALAHLSSLPEAIFWELFGDPLTNPNGWASSETLGNLAEIVSGVTKGRQLRGRTTRVVPYLAVVNVQDRFLDLSILKTIQATDDEIGRYRLQPNDLLLTEGGDPDKVGRGTLWGGEIAECIHQNHVFRVRLLDKCLNPVFLNYLVGSSRGKSYFLKSAKQTTGIASINMTQLRGFPLLIPPRSLQDEFAHRVLHMKVVSGKTLRAATELDALFASLQRRAFRGEL